MVVNTVLGPLSPDDMGVTLVHEHILFGFPGCEGHATIAPFNHDDALAASMKYVGDAKECGVQTIVDATMNDTGRKADFLKEVSEKSGVNIVCATGYYTETSGAAPYFKTRKLFYDAEAEIYELFMTEVTVGITGSGIKAGVIKIGSSYNTITEYEKMLFRAAGRVSQETGVPVITHTEGGTMGPEQCELLISSGADPKHIMIGHQCDSLDMRYHLRTLKYGVSLGFDRMGVQGILGLPDDEERIPIIIGLAGVGYADKIMFSHDGTAYWLGKPFSWFEISPTFKAYPTHTFKTIIPALKAGGVTDEQINAMLVDNPRRLFAA